jgi:hypothetical protein
MGGIARALGRHRRAWQVAALGLLLAGPWAWWATQLWGLPDVGDPFEVAAFEAERVPDDRNAFLWYRDAAAMTSRIQRTLQAQKKTAFRLNKFEGEWSKADPSWRDFLAQAGEALAIWRIGSEKPDARYDHPEGLSIRTLLPVSQELGMLARLAVLEGSRLEAEGDMAGAWGWYRAALRSSRHSGKHGFQVERLIGGAMHDVASKALTRWASDPRVDAPLLRRALDEVIAIDAMTVPRAETLKLEYLLFVASLSDPNLIEDFLVSKNLGDEKGDWCQELPVPDHAKRPIQAARVLVADDYTRSLRVTRLMVANWMAQLDKLPARRSKLFRVDPSIYGADPAAPPASRALPPEELSRWLDSSLLASRYFRGLGKFGWALDRERTRQAKLVVHLADQLYRREHGGPPHSPGALVGPYLKALPEGFEQDAGPAEARP